MKESRYFKEMVLIILVLVGISLFLVGYDDGIYTMTSQDMQESAQKYAVENHMVLGTPNGVENTWYYVARDLENAQRSVAILFQKSKLSETYRKSGVKPLTVRADYLFVLTLDLHNTKYDIEINGFDTILVGSQESADQNMDPALLPFLGYLVLVGFLYQRIMKKKQEVV